MKRYAGLLTAAFFMLAWNIAYWAGRLDLGAWTLLFALIFGTLCGAFLVVYARVLR